MTTSSHKLQNQCFLIQAYYVSLCSIFNTDYFLQRNCGQFIRSYLPHFADIKHKLIKKKVELGYVAVGINTIIASDFRFANYILK